MMSEEKEFQEEKTQDQLFSERARAELKVENGDIVCVNSPLQEVDPTALDELVSRIDKALKLEQIPDENDVNKIVTHLRLQRQKFLAAEAAKPVRSPAEKKQIAAKNKAKVTSVKSALSITDL